MSNVTNVGGSPMLELAVLLIENDALRGEVDQQNLENARHAEERAAAEQVEALHDAADAAATGALVEGSLTVAGAGLSIGAIRDASKGSSTGGWAQRFQVAGDATERLANPVGRLFGEVPRMHAQAEAAGAEQAANRAGNAADDARSHAAHVERHEDAVLDLVNKILDTEAQGNAAVLGNF